MANGVCSRVYKQCLLQIYCFPPLCVACCARVALGGSVGHQIQPSQAPLVQANGVQSYVGTLSFHALTPDSLAVHKSRVVSRCDAADLWEYQGICPRRQVVCRATEGIGQPAMFLGANVSIKAQIIKKLCCNGAASKRSQWCTPYTYPANPAPSVYE